MKLDKKKMIMLAVAALAAWFLFFRKKSDAALTEEEVTEAAKQSASKNFASIEDTVVSAASVITTAEDQELNVLRTRYKELSGKAAPSAYDATKLEAEIKAMEDLHDAIDRYVDLGFSASDVADMTVAEIENMIVEKEKAKKRDAWTARKKAIETIITNFRNTILDDGSAMSPKAFDTGALSAVGNLKDNELCYGNSYFASLGGITISDNYGAAKKAYTQRKTLSTAIPSGNRLKSRKGATTAQTIQKFLKTKTSLWGRNVNEYGELI